MVDKKQELARLAAVPILEGLSKRQLGGLYRDASIVNHPEGHTVVAEGRGALAFHLIRSGAARVIRGGRTVARLGPGDFFGELALIDSGPRTATIVTETPLEALVISSADFKRLVRDNQTLAWKLLVFLAGRLRAEQSGRDAAIS
jgi:CRP-like cAMP-binding protein